MNYFICDIVGTYNGSEFNREEEIKRFIGNLEKIIEIEELSELVFCFESTDVMGFVKKYMNEFSSYINNTKIKMGPQFSGDSYYANGEVVSFEKAGKMAQTAFILEGKEVNNIYFADDGMINQEMIEELLLLKMQKDYKDSHNGSLDGFKPYNKLVQFIPGSEFNSDNKIGSEEKGLSALNEILENYIKKIELKRNK